MQKPGVAGVAELTPKKFFDHPSTQGWIAKDWPFRNVAYPGRAIPWETWDRLVAAKPAP